VNEREKNKLWRGKVERDEMLGVTEGRRRELEQLKSIRVEKS